MWARYVPFYLCQRMSRLRQQRFLTLSQNKKKVVSDSPEIHLNVSKQLFLNFHFFHWFKLDLVKMAKLACDLLCQRMRHMRQHFASVCGACGSMLLAYAAHTQANCQRRRHLGQQIASVCAAYGSTLWQLKQKGILGEHVKMSFCKRMLCMRLQIARVWGACGSTLLAYAAHAAATCQRRQRIRLQIASVCASYGSTLLAQTAHVVAITKGYTRRTRISIDGACGSTLLTYAAYAVANCQRRRRIRQQFARICDACGIKLLAQTAHMVAICQRSGACGSKTV